MSNFLLILGLIILVGFPIYSHLFLYEKIQKLKDPRVFSFFSIIPGLIILGLAMYLSPAKTYIKTEACGIVNQYKMFPQKRHQIERLAIVMDQSGYIRYFDFDETLPRMQINQHICFELYDRFKNKGLSQSTVIRLLTDQ
ncbi:MAG: hypothetical protein WBG77_13815 [Acinetobacter venetianus]|uniref:hypothetical protein n=1 Tax=Acinetobacter venetianus TaxID=52133 RepID=UPI003C78996A